MTDVERLLRSALVPIEPSEALTDRLERQLSDLTDAAAIELAESNGRPLRPWLIRIAHNLAANYYRDRSRRPQTQLEDAAVIPEPHGTAEIVEGREELEAVLAGVMNLPDDRREALIMRFALDMDNREIARALGRSEGATKVLLHRAIKQLEERLREAGEHE